MKSVEQQRSEVLPELCPDRPICCKGCGYVVTRRIPGGSIMEGPEHTFRNPAGYSFHVKLFSKAKGCRRLGKPTNEASWFEAHVWQPAVCKKCESHLGWHFEKENDPSFYALIVPRLTGLKEV